jgi:hypothetical protein
MAGVRLLHLFDPMWAVERWLLCFVTRQAVCLVHLVVRGGVHEGYVRRAGYACLT